MKKKKIFTFPTNRLKHPKLFQDFDEETHDHQHSDHLQAIQAQHPGGPQYVIAQNRTTKPSRAALILASNAATPNLNTLSKFRKVVLGSPP